MRKIILAAALLAIIGVPDTARAEESAQYFLDVMLNDQKAVEGTKADLFIVWLGGVYNGISWLDTYLKRQNRKSVYCPPEKMAFTNEQVVSVLRRYVEGHPKKGNKPAGAALLFAFIDTFPCKK